MSTLKVAAINHPSASSGGLAISSSGNVTGAGLDLITTQSFTAVSSVSVNNCFSATYDNYLIDFQLTSATSATALDARVRASGTDATSNYVRQYFYTTGATMAQNTDTAQTVSGASSTYANAVHVRMIAWNPQASLPTILRTSAHYRTGATTTVLYETTLLHTTASAYDGFTVFPDSGTITGSLSVFGYRK